MRITVNLATRPFADLGPAVKRLRIGMGALAGLSICLYAGLHLLHQKAERARETEQQADRRIAAVTAEQQHYRDLMHQPDNAAVLQQAQRLNKLFDEKAFSWTLAMEDLETVLPGGEQVTTLEPARDEKTGTISVHLRVAGPRDKAVELVQNLEHSRRFAEPRITNESSESNSGPNQQLPPVSVSSNASFDLWANYNPAAPDERKSAKRKETSSAGAGDDIAVAPANNQKPMEGRMHLPVQTIRPDQGRPGPMPQKNLSPGAQPNSNRLMRPVYNGAPKPNQNLGGPQ